MLLQTSFYSRLNSFDSLQNCFCLLLLNSLRLSRVSVIFMGLFWVCFEFFLSFCKQEANIPQRLASAAVGSRRRPAELSGLSLDRGLDSLFLLDLYSMPRCRPAIQPTFTYARQFAQLHCTTTRRPLAILVSIQTGRSNASELVNTYITRKKKILIPLVILIGNNV